MKTRLHFISFDFALRDLVAVRKINHFVPAFSVRFYGQDLAIDAKAPEVASAFTFGREDLLPDVFQRIVDELNTQAGGRLEDFKYYLKCERPMGVSN